jgi:phosphoglycolate phosphatase
MKYELIIFDLDGTLAHTAPDLLGTLNRITKSYNLTKLGMAEFGQIIGHGAKAMIERSFAVNGKTLDEDTAEELLKAFLEDYAANIANETHLFDGVLEAMDTLETKGYKFALCTNKTESMARLLLEELNVTQRFLSITGGDTFDFRKPDKRHLEETAKLAGFPIEKAIMIGDSATDINAAKNADIPSIAVTFGYTEIPVEQLGANLIINDFNQLPPAIESLSQQKT